MASAPGVYRAILDSLERDIMPAKDRYHDTVVRALIKDGWTITGEQVELVAAPRRVWVDIEAVKEVDALIILVEVKGFENLRSVIAYLSASVGQYLLYQAALDYSGKNIPLYLAVPAEAYTGVLAEDLAKRFLFREDVKLIVFDPELEEIVQWIH
jgi:hypothetical protein